MLLVVGLVFIYKGVESNNLLAGVIGSLLAAVGIILFRYWNLNRK